MNKIRVTGGRALEGEVRIGGSKNAALPVLFAGGVMSNRLIAENICARFENVYFSKPAFSADNAAGVALLCRAKHQ